MTNSTAYRLGLDAIQTGDANPYVEGTKSYKDFEDGYQDGEFINSGSSYSAPKRNGLNTLFDGDTYLGRSASNSDSRYSGQSYQSCYHSHPPLILPDGTTILGGSCLSPANNDADIYIGFDSGMRYTERSYPWNAGTEILFRITDMSVPDNPKEFKKLVDWTKAQLGAGNRVHCGCIGGHGRTGMFFSALVSTYGVEDATTYVRERYCKKAVESSSQVNFLHTHFGVKKVDGYKSQGSGKGSIKSKIKDQSRDSKVLSGSWGFNSSTPVRHEDKRKKYDFDPEYPNIFS